jgi:hypothetical protein
MLHEEEAAGCHRADGNEPAEYQGDSSAAALLLGGELLRCRDGCDRAAGGTATVRLLSTRGGVAEREISIGG